MSETTSQATAQDPFLSVRSPLYWRGAAGEVKKLRTLAVSAIFLALSSAVASVFIPLPNNLRVYFTYGPKALCAAVIGPVSGLLFGLTGDLLGFVLHPTGGFFPGYTLTSMMGMFLYGLGLYRKKITVRRLALTKLLVNLVCNAGLNVLWSAILYQKAWIVYFTASLTKNLALWPVETAVLVLVFRLVGPLMERQGFLLPGSIPGRRRKSD
ncbi:MAG: folate family ECF transporter S component [Clostridia bacterium]|nr:folate family ECF transporter S component [Clostridia bacterium]MDY2928945.1 folate family ECF transporter S component [Clostridiaceae bacterium]